MLNTNLIDSIPKSYRHEFWQHQLLGFCQYAKMRGDTRKKIAIIRDWMKFYDVTEWHINSTSQSTLLWKIGNEMRDLFEFMDVYMADDPEDLMTLKKLRDEIKRLRSENKDFRKAIYKRNNNANSANV